MCNDDKGNHSQGQTDRSIEQILAISTLFTHYLRLGSMRPLFRRGRERTWRERAGFFGLYLIANDKPKCV